MFGNATVGNLRGKRRLTQDRISGCTLTRASLTNQYYTKFILQTIVVFKGKLKKVYVDEKAHKTFYVQGYAIHSVHFIYGILKKVAYGLNVN